MSKQKRGVRGGNRPRVNGPGIRRDGLTAELNEQSVYAQDSSQMNEEQNLPPSELPVTYQAISDYFSLIASRTPDGINPSFLRKATVAHIEQVTGRPLICYVTKTNGVPPQIPAYIDDSDLVGFADLTESTPGTDVDVFIVSNGGSVEASERIVRLLRERFESIRFIVPANAFSAATLICFSGDEILMDSLSTLGPIDPQFNGIPARAILRAFETLEKRFIAEGPRILTAYAPLIEKYDLHLLEICKSAEELSRELAQNWLSDFMLKCDKDDDRIKSIVQFFSDYDTHKSHGRSIDRRKAQSLGLQVAHLEETENLASLVRSLYNQYVFFFEQSPFFKLFENGEGINWGRQFSALTNQVPSSIPSLESPGPPKRSI